MEYVIILLAVVSVGATAAIVWWGWIGPKRADRKRLDAKRALLAKEILRRKQEEARIEARARRVYIVAPDAQWSKLIQDAHLRKWVEQHGEHGERPTYRYARSEQDLLGMDNFTLIVCEGWHRGRRSEKEREEMRYRIDVFNKVYETVDVQYIGEEYYSEGR